MDAIAERYSVLPSTLLKEGNTFDLQIFDIAMTSRAFESAKQSGKGMDKFYDEESLQESLNKVRNNDIQSK